MESGDGMEEKNDGVGLVALLHEVIMLVKQNMTRGFEGIGITAPQGMVVGTLSRYGRMKITELSEKIGLSNSTVSGIVDRLEKQGIVERNRSEKDKRVVYVQVTGKFEEMHQDFHLNAEKKIESILMKGTPENIQKICEGLNIIKTLLSKQ